MRLEGLRFRTVWLWPAFALLVACSSIPLKEREKADRERYEAYAGPPVDHLTWLGRFDGWNPIGRDELVVWTTPSNAYLIKVTQPCDDLRFANRVELTSTAGTVNSLFDFVKVRGWRCPIQQIRPIDYKRLKEDLRNETKQAKARENTGA
jgi:hypothetical protein